MVDIDSFSITIDEDLVKKKSDKVDEPILLWFVFGLSSLVMYVIWVMY